MFDFQTVARIGRAGEAKSHLKNKNTKLDICPIKNISQINNNYNN